MRMQSGIHVINTVIMQQKWSCGKQLGFFSKYWITDSPSAIMHNHGIQTLQLRRKNLRLKFFLLKNNILSVHPAPYARPLNTRVTRCHRSESLTTYQPRTNVFKFSFRSRAIQEWSALPLSMLKSRWLTISDKFLICYFTVEMWEVCLFSSGCLVYDYFL